MRFSSLEVLARGDQPWGDKERMVERAGSMRACSADASHLHPRSLGSRGGVKNLKAERAWKYVPDLPTRMSATSEVLVATGTGNKRSVQFCHVVDSVNAGEAWSCSHADRI